jgi:FkbM family methyltransferase
MYARIKALKEKGYTPDLILDIGAEKGDWTKNVLQIYPDAKYQLFEPIPYAELSQFISDKITVFNVILNDKEGEVDWFEMRNTGDSIFREKGHNFKGCVPVKRHAITLQHIVEQYHETEMPKNVLIKIDCQGAELPIMKGAPRSMLDRADFIILEIPLFGQYNEGVPDFLEHIRYMDSIGFIPYDIAEHHYINGFNRQVDMIFISKTHPYNGMTEFH